MTTSERCRTGPMLLYRQYRSLEEANVLPLLGSIILTLFQSLQWKAPSDKHCSTVRWKQCSTCYVFDLIDFNWSISLFCFVSIWTNASAQIAIKYTFRSNYSNHWLVFVNLHLAINRSYLLMYLLSCSFACVIQSFKIIRYLAFKKIWKKNTQKRHCKWPSF